MHVAVRRVRERLGAGRSTELKEHDIAHTPVAAKKYFTALLAYTEVEPTPTSWTRGQAVFLRE
jgi:hypothetical protein